MVVWLLRGMDNNFLFLCVLQVTLANESIVLYMCEGKVLMDKERVRPEAKASGWRNRAPEESKTQEPQEGSQTCDQATPTLEKEKDNQRHEKVDEPRRAVETANFAANRHRRHRSPEAHPP